MQLEIEKQLRNSNPSQVSLPILMDISPMAQVALLHTEMNSGLRLAPRMGMNSPKMQMVDILYKGTLRFLKIYLMDFFPLY